MDEFSRGIARILNSSLPFSINCTTCVCSRLCIGSSLICVMRSPGLSPASNAGLLFSTAWRKNKKSGWCNIIYQTLFFLNSCGLYGYSMTLTANVLKDSTAQRLNQRLKCSNHKVFEVNKIRLSLYCSFYLQYVDNMF